MKYCKNIGLSNGRLLCTFGAELAAFSWYIFMKENIFGWFLFLHRKVIIISGIIFSPYDKNIWMSGVWMPDRLVAAVSISPAEPYNCIAQWKRLRTFEITHLFGSLFFILFSWLIWTGSRARSSRWWIAVELSLSSTDHRLCANMTREGRQLGSCHCTHDAFDGTFAYAFLLDSVPFQVELMKGNVCSKFRGHCRYPGHGSFFLFAHACGRACVVRAVDALAEEMVLGFEGNSPHTAHKRIRIMRAISNGI